jgi:hypothetical protein
LEIFHLRSTTVLPRKQLTWVLIEFSILPKIRIILTELFSKWSHCHDFVYYSLLPAKIIKRKGLSHMYSHNTWIHLKWNIFCLVNSKTTQWVIIEFWKMVNIIRISTHWVVFGVKRYGVTVDHYNVLKSRFHVESLIVKFNVLSKTGFGIETGKFCADIPLLSHRKTSITVLLKPSWVEQNCQRKLRSGMVQGWSQVSQTSFSQILSAPSLNKIFKSLSFFSVCQLQGFFW